MPRRSGLEVWIVASSGDQSWGMGSDPRGEHVGEKRAWVSPQGTLTLQMDIKRASRLESQRREGGSSRAVSDFVTHRPCRQTV